MEEIDVWRSADQLIKSHGNKALDKAAARVVELSKSGDEEGMGVWLQISLAIRELQKDEPNDGGARN